MNFKRFLAMVLAVALLLTVAPMPAASAEGTPAMTIGSTTVDVSSENAVAMIPVVLADAPAFSGLEMKMDIPEGWALLPMYGEKNPAYGITNDQGIVFALVTGYDDRGWEIYEFGSLTEDYRGAPYFKVDNIAVNYEAGTVVLGSAIDIEANGTLFWVNYQVPATAVNGEYTISMDEDKFVLGDSASVDYADQTTIVPGTITVTGGKDVLQDAASGLIPVNTVVELEDDSFEYTGAAITPAVTVTYCGEVLSDEYYEVAYTNNIDKGTATATITGVNGFEGTVTKTFEITSAQNAITGVQDAYALAFGESVDLNPELKYETAVTYAVTAGDDVVSVDADGKINVLKVGEAEVTIYAAAIGDSVAAAEKTVAISVSKATPTYDVPTGLTATFGQTLADVALSAGFAWQDATASVGAVGANTFKADYTPADTTNYESVTGIDVTVTVGKADPSYEVPTGLTATYGQKLSDVELLAGFTWKDANASVGNVGTNTFTAIYTPTDTDNYNTVEVAVEVTVGKAEPPYTVPTGLTATFGQTLANVTLPAGFAWQDAETTSVGAVGSNTFKVKYTPADTTNYNVVENIEVTVIVGKADMTGVTIPESINVCAGSAAGTALNVAAPAGAQIFYSTESEFITVAVDGTVTASADSVGETASITVTVTKDNYNDVTGIVDVTVIDKENAVITMNVKTEAPIYNGNAQTIGSFFTAAPSVALEGAGDLTFTYGGETLTWADLSAKTVTDVGDFTIAADYEDDTHRGTASVTLSLQPIVLEASDFNLSGLDKEYDGSTSIDTEGYTWVVSGNVLLDDMHKLSSGINAEYHDPNAGEDKDITVKIYHLDGDSKHNYVLPNDLLEFAATGTIAPKNIAGADVGAFEEMTYTGAAQTPSAAVTIDGLNVTGSWSSVTNVADKTTFTANDNFTGSISDVTPGMKKAPAVFTAPTAAVLTYNGSAHALVTGGSANVKYSLDPNEGFASAVPAATDAGTYTVWYLIEETDNYLSVAKNSVEVTIAKADPTYTAPTGLTATYGQTLADVELLAGFVWQDADTTSVGAVGSNTFKVRYTPADTTNYNVVNDIEVTIAVSKANATADMTTVTNALLVKGYTSNVALPELPEDATYYAAGITYDSTFINHYGLANGHLVVQGTEAVVSGDIYEFKIPVINAKNYNNYTITVTLTGTEHEHVWTYTADGATIHAECSGTIGQCPGKNQSITLVAADQVYTGAAQKIASITDSIDGVANPVIVYDGDCVNVGTYTASITLGDATATVSYKITPAPITGAAVTVDAADLTYTGYAHTPAVSKVTLDGKDLTADDYTVSYANNINAGTATVTVTGKGNYKDTATGSFSIAKGTPVLTVTKVQKEYDGESFKSDDITATAKIGDKTFAGTWSVVGNVVEAGKHAVVVKFVPNDGDNLNDVTTSFANAEITPKKAVVPNEIKENKQTLNDALTIDAPEGTYTVTWYDEDGNEIPGTTEVEPNAKYSYEVKFTDDNYEDVPKTEITPYVVVDTSESSVYLTKGSTKHGAVKVTPNNPEKGEKVVITVKPAAGYEVDEVTVTSGRNSVDVKKLSATQYAFVMPSDFVKVDITYKKAVTVKFDDVPVNAWFHDAVYAAVDMGLFNGLSEDTFAPNASMNRAMLVTVLWRNAGSPAAGSASFKDVVKGSWYDEAVAWANEEGIVTGMSEDSFAPNAAITREQMATMLYRYAKYMGLSTAYKADLSGYADADKISDYAKEAMAWAVGAGLINGVSDTALSPAGTATRAQVATILVRFVEKYL